MQGLSEKRYHVCKRHAFRTQASTLTLRGKGSARIEFVIMGWHLFHRHRYQKTGPKKRKRPLQKKRTHDRETHKLKQASPRAARVKQGLDSQASERRDRRLHVSCLGASTTRRTQALASDQTARVPVRPPSQSFSSVGASSEAIGGTKRKEHTECEAKGQLRPGMEYSFWSLLGPGPQAGANKVHLPLANEP